MDDLIKAAQAQNWRQVILVRRDLNMSPGKLAAQVAHGSMAFLSWMVRDNALPEDKTKHRVHGHKTVKAYNRHGQQVAEFRGEPVDEDGVLIYNRSDLCSLAKAAAARGEEFFYCKSKDPNGDMIECDPEPYYDVHFALNAGLMWGWLEGAYTKVVLGVKDRKKLDKVLEVARERGMKEGRDFFCIRDNCLTELEPEEVDENGVGRTLTVVGFKPMPKETIDKVTGRLRLL